MAASNTSHRFSRCQVVLNKRRWSDIVILSRIGVFSFFTIWVVDFCHNLSFWNWSNFEFLQVKFLVLLQSWFRSFVTILIVECFFTIFIWGRVPKKTVNYLDLVDKRLPPPPYQHRPKLIIFTLRIFYPHLATPPPRPLGLIYYYHIY